MTALQISLKQEITDESIAAGNVNDPVIFFSCDPHSLQYAVLDPARNKFIALREYRVHTQGQGFREGFFLQIVEQDKLLKTLHPRKKFFSIFSDCNVFIPGPLFSRDNTVDYLKLSSSQRPSVAFSDKLRFADVHVVYSIPDFLAGEIEAGAGEVILANSVTAFIDQQLMLHKHNNEPVVAVNVRQGYMDIIICNGSSLLFCNTFLWKNAEDFIYYLLFTMEQLQLNPDKDEVLVYGEIEKTSASWMVSRKYIRNVNPGSRPEGAAFSYGFSKISQHQYYSLFSQQLCV